MSSAFDIARKSLDWAHEGIGELDTILRNFYAIVKTVPLTEVDPNTGHNIFKIKLTQNIPDSVDRKAFEAIQHIRNSFDQMMFAACVTIGKSPKTDVHYPWRSSPSDLEGTLTNVNSRIPVELHDVLRRQEPYGRGQTYPGGDDTIRELARIANRKHTVGVSVSGFVHGGRPPDINARKVNVLMVPMPKWDSVKNEMTLVVYSGDIDIKNNYRFAFNVIFSEAKPLEGIGIVDGLKRFANKAKTVLEDLERETIKIRGT